MLISIIITNYNYGEYLSECIDSCLQQEYANKEIVIVDDGSNDDSREIIRGYRSPIKAIFKSNGGQASAFNAGFSACAGKLIIFLDSDDKLMPHCLNNVVQNWRSSFSKIHFNLLMIGKSGSSLGETFCKRPLPCGDLKTLIIRDGNYQSMPTSGNVFSRSFLSRVMPMPEPDWRGHADAYLINLAPLVGGVGAIDEPLGYYRVHDKNISSHVLDSQIQFDKLYASIVREIKTDEVIDQFCKRNELTYNRGALINSYPHLQRVMVYDKLAHLFKKSRFRRPLKDFYYMSMSLFRMRNVPVIKMALIHSWMLLILTVPSRFAESMVIFAYERGAILSERGRPRNS